MIKTRQYYNKIKGITISYPASLNILTSMNMYYNQNKSKIMISKTQLRVEIKSQKIKINSKHRKIKKMLKAKRNVRALGFQVLPKDFI